MPSDLTAPFADALNHYPERLRRLKSLGQKSIGYFCTYTPIEIIHAAGFIPIRIIGGPGKVASAYSLIPDFICPFMKRSLEKGLKGDYGFLNGIVQGYTCDVACGMVNIWKENIAGDLFHTIPLPYNDSPESRRFYQSVIMDAIQKLNDIGGDYSDEKLEKSLNLYARIREKIHYLYRLRQARQLKISAEALHTIVQAGFVMPPESYADMLASLRNEDLVAGQGEDQRVPIMISGSLVESGEVFRAIKALGARIVSDDLCNGLRPLEPIDGDGADPVARLVDRYLGRFPCPARSRAMDRAALLAEKAGQSGADGIMILCQKFCSPHLADFPILSERLKAKGYPVMLFEISETWEIDGQLQTRMEAFLELLETSNGKAPKVHQAP